jgi:hypothetical protein
MQLFSNHGQWVEQDGSHSCYVRLKKETGQSSVITIAPLVKKFKNTNIKCKTDSGQAARSRKQLSLCRLLPLVASLVALVILHAAPIEWELLYNQGHAVEYYGPYRSIGLRDVEAIV